MAMTATASVVTRTNIAGTDGTGRIIGTPPIDGPDRAVFDFVQPEPFCRYFKSSGMSEGMSANVGTSEFFA